MPFFSVIIPTRNRSQLLRQTLDSVWAQSETDFEVIVVDDGSTDETPRLLRDLQSRLQVLPQAAAGGPGAARNRGAALAKGTYLAFLDDDDLWFSWTLQTYRQVLARYANPAFLAGKPLRFHYEHELQAAHSAPIATQRFDDYLESSDQWRWWGTSSFVVKNSSFREAGGFTPEWINGEDADLALRLGIASGFVQVTSPVTFAYREGAGSAMQNFARTVAGARFRLTQEQLGHYPGGATRARARRKILARQLRPVSLDCVRYRHAEAGWLLYRSAFWWQLRLGRIRYLLGFLFLAATRAAINPLDHCIRIGQGARSRLRNLWYRALGVELPGYVWLRQISIPRQWSDIRLEPGVALDDGVVLLCSGPPKAGKLVIRRGTYVNRHTIFDAHEQVEIGRDCLIGPFCYLTDGEHGFAGTGPTIHQPISARPIILEDNVWLGAGVTVLRGVRIGQGAVVGAGAVVTRDVAAQAIVMGVPARFTRDRSTGPLP